MSESRHPDGCQEARMGSKDKGGKGAKKAANKNLKEKRLDKKVKRDAATARANSKAL
jgi:hypothetical protein